MSIALHGVGVSKGIAIGKVHLVDHMQIEVGEYNLPHQHLDGEVQRFQAALELAKIQLRHIRDNVPRNVETDVTAFIDTHLLMLEDGLLAEAPIKLIYEHQCNAEWALKLQCDNLVNIFDEMEDPYLRSRKHDVEQVVSRVQRILRGYTDMPSSPVEASYTNAIVVADNLSPADTIFMRHHGILAFATEFGGTTSHTAILARSLGIPAIVGLRRVRTYIQPDDIVVVDGNNGLLLIVNPDSETSILDYYRDQQRQAYRRRSALNRLKDAPTQTLDGVPINLHVNIEFPDDMVAVNKVGGGSIGLFRTEFLYMNRQTPPNEEEHYQAYCDVISALDGGSVTIRTLDLGADKEIDSRCTGSATNPALGLRAIRLCLKEINLFKVQLRAILRASVCGKVHLMLPMVSSIAELQQSLAVIDSVRAELDAEGVAFDHDILVGAMVEVPAMAVCLDLFAPYLDFFSIGTNDLIQYSLAIDRVDDAVNYLYDPLHPAVLRLIYMSISTANKVAKPISMCGEMASDSQYVRLLLALGLRSFSVNPEAYLEVKNTIIHSELRGMSRIAQKMLKTATHDDISILLNKINRT